jgi:hypothetical protein
MKIKFSELVEALTAAGIVPDTMDRDYFSNRGKLYTNQVSLTIRAPRGSNYATEVSSFFVDVGARRAGRGRISTYFSLKLDGPKWRERLAKNANDLIQRGLDYKVVSDKREAEATAKTNTRQAFATAISGAVGKPLDSWDVTTGDDGAPNGYWLKVHVTGNAEDVAASITAIKAIATGII